MKAWAKRLGRLKRILSNERGISALEWIGLGAVVLVLLGGIIFYVQTQGAGQIGGAVQTSMNEQIGLWEEGGGRSGPYSRAESGLTGYPGAPGGDVTGGGLEGPTGGQQGSVLGAATEACPDCRPNWLKRFFGAIFNAPETYKSAFQRSRLVPFGKYFKVYKGAPTDLYPGRYLTTHPRIVSYTTGQGIFWTTLKSGRAWGSNAAFAFGANFIEYTRGEKRDVGIFSTDFAAAVSADTIASMATGAAAAAIVGAAGLATAPALVTLAIGATAFGLKVSVDWVTCKLTGRTATDWLKAGVKGTLDRAKGWLSQLL